MKFQKDIFGRLKVYGFDLRLMMWVTFALVGSVVFVAFTFFSLI